MASIEFDPTTNKDISALIQKNREDIDQLLQPRTFDESMKKIGALDFRNSKLPLEVPYAAKSDQFVMTNSTGFSPPEEKGKPGFFSTLGHGFVEQNEFFALERIAKDGIGFKNPLMDTEFGKEQDWVSIIDNAGIYTPRWIQYVMESTSENDMEARIAEAQARETQAEYLSQGSGLANFFGGMAGAILSPSSLIPISATVKYAKLGKNVLNNMARTLPGITTQSLAHAAAIDLSNQQFVLAEYAEDAAIDAMFGTILVGAGAGLMSGKLAFDTYNIRNTTKMTADGVQAMQKIGKDGEFIKYEVKMLRNESRNAAKVDKWQSMLDSRAAKKGMFQYGWATKAFSKGNPLVKWLTGIFDTMADLTNRLADHSITTEGVISGSARPQNVEELVKKAKSDAILTTKQLDSLYAQSIGLNPDSIYDKTVKKKMMQMQDKQGFYSRDEFNYDVSMAVINDTQHTNQFVNEAANLLNDKFTQYYESFLDTHGLDKDIFPPKTAKGYLMRMYDRDYVASSSALGNESFVTIVANELQRQDNMIIEHGSRLKAEQAQYEKLKQEKIDLAKAEDFDTNKHRLLREQLDEASERVRAEQSILRDKMKNDEDLHILLEHNLYLNSAEESDLRNILKPINEAENQFQEAKAELSSVQKLIKQNESKIAKAKTEKKLKELTEQNKTLQSQLDELQGKGSESGRVRELENQFNELKDELNRKALNGQIPKRYFRQTGNQVEFRDPNQVVRFRDLYDNHREAATRFEQSILNYNPQQLNQSVLSNFSGGVATNPLKSRSLMVPDSLLRENKFLSNDLNKMTILYIQNLASRTAVKQALVHPQFGEGFEAFTQALSEEMQIKRDKISSQTKKSTKQKQKELIKLDREFKEAEKAIGRFQDFVYGNSLRDSAGLKFARNLRNYTTATRLGAMMLSSLSDTGGIILKHGIWNYLKDGLAPLLKSAFIKAGKAGAEGKENATHAGMAMEHVLGSFSESAYNPSMFDGVYMSGKVTSALEKLNHVAMNLYGQTFVDNINQMITANISQSKFMSYLQKFKDGTITARQKEALNQAGIQPEIWADRFLEQFEKFGGEKSGASYQSRYWDWQDVEAMQTMVNGIRRSVNESVLKSNWLDAPLWSNDPFPSMILLFHKWGFSAMSRWVLPAMQRPDAKALTGITMMIGLGALVDPLRKWAKTGKFEWDEDAAFLNAISNSSVGGWYWDVIENLNAVLGHSLLPNKNDRRQSMSIGSIIGGAPGGVMDDAFHIITSLINQNTTRKDAQKALNLLPLTGAWYLRYLTNQFLDQLDLPDRRPPKQNIFWQQG